MDATTWIVLGGVLTALALTELIISQILLRRWIKKFKEE